MDRSPIYNTGQRDFTAHVTGGIVRLTYSGLNEKEMEGEGGRDRQR